jgi:hypothetical protein
LILLIGGPSDRSKASAADPGVPAAVLDADNDPLEPETAAAFLRCAARRRRT